MRTLESVPQVRSVTYAAPMKREDALTEGDWERAYALACHEDRVEYLAAPAPRKPKPRRKQ